MPSLILPSRYMQQPQQGAVIDWGNPLTRGLVVAFNPPAGAVDGASGGRNTYTGTKANATVKGIAAGFGSMGQGSTDVVVAPAIPGAVTQRTYLCLFNQAGTGGGGLGRLWDAAGTVTGVDACYITAGGTVWQVSINGTQQSNYTTSGVSTGNWNTVVCAIDTVAQYAQTYLNGVANYVAPGQSTTATGTLQPANNPAFGIGNRGSDKARNFDGMIACFFVWNRILTPAEVAAITANPWQVFKAPARRLWLAATAPGASGTLASTLAGAALAASGQAANQGALASTLDGATLAAAGLVAAVPSGSLSSALDGTTLAAAGNVADVGALASTMTGCTMAASGIALNPGSFTSALAGASMSASGQVITIPTGTLSSALDGVALAAGGYVGTPPAAPNFFIRLPKNPRHVLPH